MAAIFALHSMQKLQWLIVIKLYGEPKQRFLPTLWNKLPRSFTTANKSKEITASEVFSRKHLLASDPKKLRNKYAMLIFL